MTNRVALPLTVSARRRADRLALLAGVSVLAMASVAPQPLHARALHGSAGTAAAAPALASEAAALAARQAAAAARSSQDSLARTTRAMQDLQAVQATARAVAAARQTSLTAPVGVPNGLGAGGLLPNVPAGWTGAGTPTQTTDGAGQTQVGIKQTTAQAILNWTSFNVGARTTLTFDQQGNAGWVALNRVNAATNPSQILGNINADGQVYVINQSGIIFGGSSQVNVGALIASSAGITDAQFLTRGIHSTQANGSYTPSFTAAGGAVRVEEGALLATRVPTGVTAAGGFVLLMGSQVSNAGSIITLLGQVQMAAGDNFVLRPGYSTDANQISTTRGNEIAPLIATGSAGGKVSNTGLIFSQQGDITLAGRTVQQDGVAVATTSVNNRGTVHLLNSVTDTAGNVSLGAGSVTAVLPELDTSESALNSQRDGLIANKLPRRATVIGQFDNLSPIDDRIEQSRIEVVSGGNVTFKGGSSTAAQGGQVAVKANKIVVEDGASIDVSGVRGVVLPMSANNILINVQGNELRDSPLNRDLDNLRNKDIWIDLRSLTFVPTGTGGYDGDRYYTPGGLLEVGGYLAKTSHGIGEWAAVGGTITLAANEVTAMRGASFNVSGGSLDYQGGYIRTSNLLGSDGRIYGINSAPGNIAFMGLAGSFVRTHNIQGQVDDKLTEIWTTVFDRGGTSLRWEDGYTVGRDAGSLVLLTPKWTFEADIIADIINGQRQTASRPSGVTDGYKLGQTQAALAGRLSLADYDWNNNLVKATSAVTFGAGPRPVDAGAGNWLDSAALSGFGLGGISVSSSVKIEGDLRLAAGGALNLTGGAMQVKADVIAPGGSVVIDGTDVTVASGATVDTSGLWTNLFLDPDNRAGLANINGGSISLTASGKLKLEAGSRLDASAGGAILEGAKTSGGNGGNIALSAVTEMVIDGKLAAMGFGKGGTLTITDGGGAIVIGGQPLKTNGQLAAGEIAPIPVALAEAITLDAGAISPINTAVSIRSVTNGMKFPSGAFINAFSSTTTPAIVIGSAGWTVPSSVFALNMVGQQIPAGTYLAAGTGLKQLSGTLAINAVIPVGTFATPVPLSAAVTYQVTRGEILPAAVTLAAGTILPTGTVLTSDVKVRSTLSLETSLFGSGFSAYTLSSPLAVSVQPGVVLDVVQPVYSFTADSRFVPTGSDPASASVVALLPLFTDNVRTGELRQRGGADLMIGNPDSVSVRPGVIGSQGDVMIGEGARITVDPGRSVRIGSAGQITIEGAITAHGGNITAVNNTLQEIISGQAPYVLSGRSVWIGSDAVLDVSGIAVTAMDMGGARHGIVTGGGFIVLGALDKPPAIDGLRSGNAFVVVRPGAILDASGASAVIDLVDENGGFARGTGQRETVVASDGGKIALASQWGIFLDGTARAFAGGAGASGGTLAIMLETPVLALNYDVPVANLPAGVMNGRVLTIAQEFKASTLAGDLKPGALGTGLVLGQGRLSVTQVERGGFDSLSLFGRTAIAFDGNIDLALGRSLTLQQGTIYNTTAGATVRLDAPYVLLDGRTYQDNLNTTIENFAIPDVLPTYPAGDTLTIAGDLIDIRNQVRTVYRTTEVSSRGDLRFLVASSGAYARSSPIASILAASGNLALRAAQVYPASGATATAAAGTSETLNFQGLRVLQYGGAGGRLTVSGTGITPDLPYSAFGDLTLSAETVLQGGVVRAPMGSITIGLNALSAQLGKIELLPGSITSVSAAGLVMPYGGTTDGVSYKVDGADYTGASAISGEYFGTGSFARSFKLGIHLNGRSILSDAGAVLDLSGGGTLAGAAFVSGRGGSVDTLLTPSINSNPGNKNFSAASNKVYAIVPGIVTAPTAGGYAQAWTGAVPTIGQQITVPAGVPGLPAGTYTLLPANYALMPGGFRVELGPRIDQTPRSLALGNGSYRVVGTQSVANTDIRDALGTTAVITPGTAVRQYAQYNEQGYASFIAAQAAQFGTVRKLVEADGKFLTINVRSRAGDAANGALVFNGSANLDAGVGGYSGWLNLTVPSGAGDLVITGAGSTIANTATLTTVSERAIDAINAPNLLIGGGFYDQGTYVDVGLSRAGATNVVVGDGVTLSASQVFVSAANQITLGKGAEISALGRGFSSIDSRSGRFYGTPAVTYATNAVLVVSNGDITLNTPSGIGAASIVMQEGSGLYSEGTIGFYSDRGLAVAGNIGLGTRNLVLNVASLNIGTRAALAAVGTLPNGLALDQGFLNALLSGSGRAGVPAMERLTLGATNAINFFGSIDLSTIDPVTGKSRLGELIFNSPAIYGYGAATDTVHLATDTLVWNGNAVLDQAATDAQFKVVMKSAAPGARIAGLGDSGGFSVDARRVVFGYPSQSRPDMSLTFDRLMLGFGAVAFNATESVSANARGTVSIYRGGADPSAGFKPATYAGSGGTLTFNTPLMTGAAGAVVGIYGSTVAVQAPGGAAPAGTAGGLGADLSITGDTVRVASAVVLPAGKLGLTARQGDVLIDNGGRLDLSGHVIDFGGVKRQAWGGDLTLTSTNGNVVQAAGAIIDVSSDGSDAGTLTIKAAQAASFTGALNGKGGGNGARDGAINLSAAGFGGGDLSADFAAFNSRLTPSGFNHSRSFTLTGGDLTVGNDVHARNVSITVDGGKLTIDGRIDASGRGAGAVRLSARDDVVLTGNAVLDLHGTSLVTDNQGKAIDASNRASVEITTKQGWLRLNAGATIDTSSTDGVARGRVELNARRSTETGGDIDIDASGPLNLTGIGSLAVNGYWTYSPTDSNGTIVQDNTATGAPAGAVGLNQIDVLNTVFYKNALANAALQARLAGLQAVGAAYHLRPGVEIVSSAASGGKLTVSGDLDLSGYRYGTSADRDVTSVRYGFGEPLALTIRAADNLDIKGSITDGFAPPKSSPDENGFRDRPGGVITAPYQAPYDYYNPGGMRTLTSDWTVPSDGWFSIVDASDNWYYSGAVIPAGTKINFDWSWVEFMTGGSPVPSFKEAAVDPQGKIYAIAPMLAPGAMSASIRLVGGANLLSSDARALRSAGQLAGTGNLVLDDYHTHNSTGSGDPSSEIFSVIRTGTGDLELLSGGNLVLKSLYGIYTAGTQSDLQSDNAAFKLTPAGTLPGNYELTRNDRASYYPDHGGDLLVVSQGSLSGYSSATMNDTRNWLLLQGAPELGQKTAWSINFGSYRNGADVLNMASATYVAGFTGFGALGGGNVAIRVADDAGGLTPASSGAVAADTLGNGITVAVAATGRLTSGGLVQTGGGDIDIVVGGALNPMSGGGLLTDLRGAISLTAGSVGRLPLSYTSITGDPRAADPYVASMLLSNITGPGLALGDAAATFRSRGDLSLGAVIDPGLVEQKFGGYSGGWAFAPLANANMLSWFPLWQKDTAIDLLSLGGNLSPLSPGFGNVNMLPPVFRAAAASGSIYLANMASGNPNAADYKQMPSPRAELELLAQGSIFDALTTISMSAADPALMPDIYRPAYVVFNGSSIHLTNTLGLSNGGPTTATYGLFAFAPDMPTGDLHAGDPNPVRIRALTGDIVGLRLNSAKRLDMAAAGDIVATSNQAVISIIHADAKDVSVVSAGGDVIYPTFRINGPGTLDVAAGRNVTLDAIGSIVSNGPAYAGDRRPGASLAITAGAAAPDYDRLAALYLDPARLAVSGTPLADQQGKVAKVYTTELRQWLHEQFGHVAADDAAARDYFMALAPERQNVFLRMVYFAELRAGGREYNDRSSPRFGSYLRGRMAIATLFPDQDAAGQPINYMGDITMFGASGMRTVAGGDIQLLTPGGRQVVGVEGVVPPASSGLVTQGAGNIQLYAKGSVLLGLSRIMTTFGGDILAWSAEGDINAGRGAKTSVLYAPPKRIYDRYGNVELSPNAPSTGAGIATLASIARTVPGDVDLIAPLGTIDAGEAGIRSSGNVNLAALQIVNAANIRAQGTSTGIPTVEAPNISAALSATNATAATQQAAAPNQGAGNDRPSVIIVEVLGYGGGSEQPDERPDRKRQGALNYDPSNPVRIIGNGAISDREAREMTDQERSALDDSARSRRM